MTAHLGENRRQRAYLKWASCRDGHVVLAVLGGVEAHVAA